LPVVLGTLGGIGLLIGPAGLLAEKSNAIPRWSIRRAPAWTSPSSPCCSSPALTGIALLLWRDTAAMGPLLALHLGVVFSLFITMPYGKFVHGIYRYVALVRYARERQMMAGSI
jgi:citrate/tricarballylate utilization protein